MNLEEIARKHVEDVEKFAAEETSEVKRKSRVYEQSDLACDVAYLYDEPLERKSGNPHVELVKSTIADWLYNNLPSQDSICIINPASYKKVGGGFLDGSYTREEALCHVSNLYNVLMYFENTFYKVNLKSLRYGLYTNRMLWTPGISVYKENTMDVLGKVDIISVAPPYCRTLKSGDIPLTYADTAIYERLMYAYGVAAGHKEDVLVIGAYGCGSSGNDPYIVADTIDRLTKRFGEVFKRVVCVIPDDVNYTAFNKIINNN